MSQRLPFTDAERAIYDATMADLVKRSRVEDDRLSRIASVATDPKKMFAILSIVGYCVDDEAWEAHIMALKTATEARDEIARLRDKLAFGAVCDYRAEQWMKRHQGVA